MPRRPSLDPAMLPSDLVLVTLPGVLRMLSLSKQEQRQAASHLAKAVATFWGTAPEPRRKSTATPSRTGPRSGSSSGKRR